MRNLFSAGRPLSWGAEMVARLSSLAPAPGWLTTVTPTADIYFLNAMRDLVSHQGRLDALGPNVYGAGDRFVILRYASDGELARLEAARPQQVFYVIDDDLEALSRSAELPAGYRSRLAGFVARLQPRILALADVILAPNPLILARFGDRATGLIWPSHMSLCDDFGHFADGSPLRLLFTGSRSHVADLEMIAAALQRLCTAHPEVELTTFLGSAAPASLRNCANVVNRKALTWEAYKRLMATARFHIALAPFHRTATNECRSHNKVHDHAAFGAAGLYGDILPYREIVSHGTDGLLLPPDPEAWLEALRGLVEDPASALRLAEGGAGLSGRIGSPIRLRDFWCERLGLD